MLPRLQTCCVCTTLRNGCLIIAAANLLFSIYPVYRGVHLISWYARSHKGEGAVLFDGILSLITAVIIIGIGLLLLLGVLQNKPGHIKWWKSFAFWTIIVTIVMIILSLYNQPSDWHMTVGVHIAFMLPMCYFYIVVRSYHLDMTDAVDLAAAADLTSAEDPTTASAT